MTGGDVKDPFGLRPLWDAVLEIYDEFARICDKHKLRYFVTDGSAIGAVRHHGFIPWDDDLDVTMPRPDYERFLQIAALELPAHLKIVNSRNTDEFTCSFGKIQDCRREKIEGVEEKVGYRLSGGLFLDIFIMDGYPVSKLERKMNAIRGALYHSIVRSRAQRFSWQTRKGKIAWLGGRFLSLLFPFRRCNFDFLKVTERHNRKYAYGSTPEVGISGNKPWPLRHYPFEWWDGEPVMFDFEGRKVPLPHCYDSYLRSDYGDYMKLPPESARHSAHSYKWRSSWWLGPTKG